MIPVIRIEMDGIRQQVASMLADHNNELEKMINAKLEATLTEEWVEKEIADSVDICIRTAIRSLTDNYRLQSIITDAIVEKLEAGRASI